jgi:hypothetical protein
MAPCGGARLLASHGQQLGNLAVFARDVTVLPMLKPDAAFLIAGLAGA